MNIAAGKLQRDVNRIRRSIIQSYSETHLTDVIDTACMYRPNGLDKSVTLPYCRRGDGMRRLEDFIAILCSIWFWADKISPRGSIKHRWLLAANKDGTVAKSKPRVSAVQWKAESVWTWSENAPARLVCLLTWASSHVSGSHMLMAWEERGVWQTQLQASLDRRAMKPVKTNDYMFAAMESSGSRNITRTIQWKVFFPRYAKKGARMDSCLTWYTYLMSVPPT